MLLLLLVVLPVLLMVLLIVLLLALGSRLPWHDGGAREGRHSAVSAACLSRRPPSRHELALSLCFVPLLSCCSDKPVIKKALVEIHGPAMTSYTSMRAIWAIQDWCRSPGPIQVCVAA